MKSVGKGLVLGAANVILIAIGIAMQEGSAEAAALVMMIGMIPGVIAGVILGVVGGQIEGYGLVARLAALTLPAVAVVIWLASEFGMEELILVASIPSVVAALLLERWTRKVVMPPVPVAQLRVG